MTAAALGLPVGRGTDRPSRLVWLMPALTVLAWLIALLPPLSALVSPGDVLWSVPFLTFPAVGVLIVRRQSGNRVGWVLCGIGLGMSLSALHLLLVRHLSADPSTRVAASWVRAFDVFSPIGFGLIVVLLMIFPTGRLPSPRWRVALAALAVLIGLVLVDQAVRTDGGPRLATSALASPRLAAVLDPITSFDLYGGFLLIGAAALVARYRTSGAVERAQIKWFAVSAAALVLLVGAGGLLDALGIGGLLAPLIQMAGFVIFGLGVGFAVVRHHLYDVDVVISRGLAYTALVVLAAAVYIAVVGGLGVVVGRGSRGNLLLSLLATAVIAVAFHPVQLALRKGANRLVFGRRHTPYESLAGFTRWLAQVNTDKGLVQGMADALAEGVRADAVAVYLDGGDVVATSPAGVVPPDRAPDRSIDVRHAGEHLGSLAVWTVPGVSLNSTEVRLLADLGVQAGLVLHNARLTLELQRRVEELRASRRRLVTAQDAERRRFERDLHDGAQHDLVAVRMKLGQAERVAAAGADPELAAVLAQARDETAIALENLRRLSRGLYPPLLESQGLTAALTAHARRLPMPVSVQGDGFRFGREVETAAYFCCVEALQNAVKHAPGAAARLVLDHDGEVLRLRIEDDGPGFAPDLLNGTVGADGVRTGSGLQNIGDRVEALGGTLRITSGPDGTRLDVRIPATRSAGTASAATSS